MLAKTAWTRVPWCAMGRSVPPADAWLPWVAMAIAFVSVSPTLVGGFVLDDVVAVEQSACVTSAFDPARIFTTNFWCEPGPLYSIQSWRPWPVLVWWGLFRLGGTPGPFHVLNVGLHLLCTWQLLALGRDLGLPPRSASIGALLFAPLAIHVDAVALVVGAAELWMALFVLLCVREFVRGRWSCIPLAALAVLSKESGVLALPLVVVVAVLAPDAGRFGGRRGALLAIAGILLVDSALLALRADIIGAWTGSHIPAHVNPLVMASPWVRLVTGVAIIGRYHRLTAIGSPLSADYAHAALGIGDRVALLDVTVGVCAILGWLALSRRLRRNTGVGVLCAWVLGTSVFFGNLLFVLPALFAERLFYLPSMALALLAGMGFTLLLKRSDIRRSVVVGAIGLVVLLQTVQSMVHAWRYGDELRLIEATVASTPENARARMWLARRMLDAGRPEAALEHAQVAARVRPSWGAPVAVIATAEDLQGRPEAALQGFRAAFELDPTEPEAANLFIQFLLRYGHREQARLVYRSHARARGNPHPDVTVP